MNRRRGREGYELIVGPGTINAWRKREFSADQKERELEIACTFSSALSEDLYAHPSDDEPFDVEIFSKSENKSVAGVQLVEAYDDARRSRDDDRWRAMRQLGAREELAKVLEGWQILIQTASALAPGAESNKISSQLPIIQDLLTHHVDWSREQFSVGDALVRVSGKRRISSNAGTFSYLWSGGLLPYPEKSVFSKAVASKIAMGYSRKKEPAFWLLVYSLWLAPEARDRRECRNILERQNTFDEIFLLDVMGGALFPLSEPEDQENLIPADPKGAAFQLDPGTFLDAGSFQDDNFVEVNLPKRRK